ncbi:MAG TPA: methyltransferase domain-containing protein [Gemmataceae bacterium]|jgi:phospholipid N-methyltransferase|nr:methyltransferase domain-containing protein [Gemmataceae bacterium]
MGDLWLVLRKFFSNAKTVATIAPSSRALSRAILRGIDWSKTKTVVELGAGTGPITNELVKVAPPSARLVVNEFLPDFCVALRQKFPGLDVVEGDARRLGEMMAERGIAQVDYILSGLPLTHFKPADRDAVIDQCGRLMGPTGEFRQLTTAPWLYRKLYRRYFREVSFRLVVWNLPPGGVYYCRGWIPPEERSPLVT